MKPPKKDTFHIVHLSDLHLTASDQVSRSEPAFSHRLKGMNDSFRRLLRSDPLQQADLLLVTGDITDKGETQAWRQFNQALSDAGLTAKTIVVLGNHDVCDLSARLGWPRQLKKADLQRARQGLTISRQPVQYPWARQVEDRIVVFGLDSNNSGNLSVVTNAVGRIGFRQLAAFAALLHKHRETPVKIVALHHSPNIPDRATSLRRGRPPVGLVTRWLHQLPEEDRHALRLLCITHRVRLVLHGHLHAAEDRSVNGIRMIGAPAATELVGRGKQSVYQFYQYTIRWPAARVERNLKTVMLPDPRGVTTPPTAESTSRTPGTAR